MFLKIKVLDKIELVKYEVKNFSVGGIDNLFMIKLFVANTDAGCYSMRYSTRILE